MVLPTDIPSKPHSGTSGTSGTSQSGKPRRQTGVAARRRIRALAGDEEPLRVHPV